MAGFLYFASGESRPVSLEVANEWKLGYAFQSVEHRPVNSNSPSGTRGVVFADPSCVERCAVDIDQQDWRKMPTIEGRPEIWIGFDPDNRPTPDDLARETLLPGLAVRLNDDNHWQVPNVRSYRDGTWRCELPCYLDYDDSGKLVRGEPLDECKELWELTTEVGSTLVESNGAAITDESACEIAVKLLASNYVVDLPELACLQLLSVGDTLPLIVLAACRHDELVEWAGKKGDED